MNPRALHIALFAVGTACTCLGAIELEAFKPYRAAVALFGGALLGVADKVTAFGRKREPGEQTDPNRKAPT